MSDTNFFKTDNETLQNTSPQVIPVIQETASVGKKTIETGVVKVYKTVTEKDETIDVSLLNDEYVIEHVPMNKLYEQAPQTRQEGDTLVVPIVKEVMVKRLMLVEEIRITKKTVERTEQHNVLLRSESVNVSRTSANQ